MSFIYKNFPDWWDIHNSRASHIAGHRGYLSNGNKDGLYGIGRSLVADWARCGAIDVNFNDDGEPIVRTQMENTTLCDWKLIGHSYPLASNYNPIDQKTHAEIAASKIRAKLHRLTEVLHTNKTLHLRITHSVFNKIQEALKNTCTDEDLFNLVQDLPTSLYNTVEHNPDVIERKFINSALSMVDSKYSNNIAMSQSTPNDNTPIFYLTGSKMNKIASSTLNLRQREIQPVDEPWFQLPDEFSSKIYGINLCCSDQRLVVRRKACVDIFSRNNDSGAMTLPFDNRVYSSFPSEFVSEQTLVTLEDTLILLSGNKSLANFYVPMNSCNLHDVWSWAEFANHPTQFIYTDRSQCILWDARCYNSQLGKPSQFLFDVKDEQLNPKEHLYHFKQLGTHRYDSCYFLLCSNFSSLVMDRRMPRHPLLHWTNALLHPCVLSDTAVGKDEVEHLFMGSQAHREASYLNLSLFDDAEDNQPLQLRGPSLAFSDISLGLSDTLPERNAVKDSFDRVYQSSIIGLAGLMIGEEKCLSLRLTSWGDLFAQEAKLNPSSRDKAFVNDLVKERFVSWMNASTKQSSNEPQIDNLDDSIMSDMFSDEISQSKMIDDIQMDLTKHICCGFCQPDPRVVNFSVIDDICANCGSEIRLWSYDSRELLQDDAEDYRDLLPSVPEGIPKTAITKRIDHLWHGNLEKLLNSKTVKKFINESDKKDELFVSYCKYTHSKTFKVFNMRRRLFDASYQLEWENMQSSYFRALAETPTSTTVDEEVISECKDDDNDQPSSSHDRNDSRIEAEMNQLGINESQEISMINFPSRSPIISSSQTALLNETANTKFAFNSTVLSQQIGGGSSRKRLLPSGFGGFGSQRVSKNPKLDLFFSQSQSQLF